MAYPIVLAHGIARFDALFKDFPYWNGVPKILSDKGYIVHQTNIDWAGPVVKRAEELADQIENLISKNGYEKVNIIGHSSGGLDARYAIAKNGLASKVASLTTLGTPHHGTPFADAAFENGVAQEIISLSRVFGEDMDGFKDLTSEECRKRNNELKEFEDKVQKPRFYRTYAGVQPIENIFWLLLLSYRVIKRREVEKGEPGDNDGLVPVESAKWKDEYSKGIYNFDHLNLLGWWDSSESGLLGRGRTKAEFEKEISDFYLGLAGGLP